MSNHGFPHGFQPHHPSMPYRSDTSSQQSDTATFFQGGQPPPPYPPRAQPPQQPPPPGYGLSDPRPYGAPQGYPGMPPPPQPYAPQPMPMHMQPPFPGSVAPMYAGYAQPSQPHDTRSRDPNAFINPPVSTQMRDPVGQFMPDGPYHDRALRAPIPPASVGMQPSGPMAPQTAPPGASAVELNEGIYRDAVNTFNRFDVTNDGYLELSEFMDALRALHLAITYHDALEKFRISDEDQNGRVSRDEFVRVYANEVRKRAAQQPHQRY